MFGKQNDKELLKKLAAVEGIIKGAHSFDVKKYVMNMVRTMLEDDKSCCEEHNVIPQNAADWEAVYTKMAIIYSAYMDYAKEYHVRLLRSARLMWQNEDAAPITELFGDLLQRTMNMSAIELLLNAHGDLLLHMHESGKQNADLHYMAIMNIVEIKLSEKDKTMVRIKDSVSRMKARLDEIYRSTDRPATEEGRGDSKS